jgi:hypothetical protein
MKRDRDDTVFRERFYDHRERGCLFCQIPEYPWAFLPELKTADMKDAIRYYERRPAGEPFVRFSIETHAS